MNYLETSLSSTELLLTPPLALAQGLLGGNMWFRQFRWRCSSTEKESLANSFR